MDTQVRRSSYSEANRSLDVFPEIFGDPMFKKSSTKVKETSKNANLFAEDGCYLLDRVSGIPAEKQFYEFQQVLKWMGLLFEASSTQITRTFQYSWLTFLLFISFYTVVHDFYFLATDFHSNFAPSTLVVAAITFQGSISTLFSLHWQKNLHFQAFFHTWRHSRIPDIESFEKYENRVFSGNRRQFWGFQVYALLSALVFIFAIWSGLLKKLVHPSFITVFYCSELCYVRPFFFVLHLSIVTNNLETYLCLTNAIHCELKKFNYKIVQLKEVSRQSLKDELQNLIYQHTKITCSIRLMDDLYKVYAFMVTACVIPLTIFVLTLVLTRSSLMELMVSLPTVGFCTFELYAIMYPSRLSEEFSKSKSLLCMCHNVWIPYEENVNKIAQTLAIHLDQPDLGVSLWGFTLVTKPLILTTVSAMMTCLAFLLDLRPKEENANACRCPSNSTNDTQTL
ncbi:unnamed protein product, partial [Mesorhabditis belari]|uniref:Gustatory receptor n=1 Tax=Mesorhabditis belari TaxID=2138241 RepID=A0AAF3EYV9_9BILA